MINKFVYKKLKEISPEALYQPPAESLLVHYDPPTDVEKQALLEALHADKDVPLIDAGRRKGFREFLFELERELPIINTEGRPVKGNIRLAVCFEMAKILYLRRKGVPRSLRSVIIEAEHVFLTRHADAAGLATSDGPKTFLPAVAEVQHTLSRVFLMVWPKEREDDEKLHRLERQFKQVKKLADKEPLSDFYREKLSGEIQGMKESFTYLFDRLVRYGQTTGNPEWKASIETNILPYKENIHKVLSLMNDSLSAHNKGMHLYISWPYYLSNQYDKKGRNVILHETAHAIDFDNDGFNGIPAPALLHQVDEREWHNQWRKQFDQATAGQMDFLDAYALKNKLEFLAVSTELFFHRSDLIKEKAPELFGLLEKTYGYVPGPETITSWKKVWKIPEMFKRLNNDLEDILNR
ncbi:zinc-dependent peptidase [Parapedobacter sp.]